MDDRVLALCELSNDLLFHKIPRESVMEEARCEVVVYQDSIRELAAHSAWEGRSLTPEQALDVHLAHEFFHIWEYRERRSIAEELEPVVSMSFLGLRRRVHINRCGEIAAHAFAKELLGLPFLPNFYDYRYLIDTGAMTQADMDHLIARMLRAR